MCSKENESLGNKTLVRLQPSLSSLSLHTFWLITSSSISLSVFLSNLSLLSLTHYSPVSLSLTHNYRLSLSLSFSPLSHSLLSALSLFLFSLLSSHFTLLSFSSLSSSFLILCLFLLSNCSLSFSLAHMHTRSLPHVISSGL